MEPQSTECLGIDNPEIPLDRVDGIVQRIVKGHSAPALGQRCLYKRISCPVDKATELLEPPFPAFAKQPAAPPVWRQRHQVIPFRDLPIGLPWDTGKGVLQRENGIGTNLLDKWLRTEYVAVYNKASPPVPDSNVMELPETLPNVVASLCGKSHKAIPHVGRGKACNLSATYPYVREEPLRKIDVIRLGHAPHGISTYENHVETFLVHYIPQGLDATYLTRQRQEGLHEMRVCLHLQGRDNAAVQAIPVPHIINDLYLAPTAQEIPVGGICLKVCPKVGRPMQCKDSYLHHLL